MKILKKVELFQKMKLQNLKKKKIDEIFENRRKRNLNIWVKKLIFKKKFLKILINLKFKKLISSNYAKINVMKTDVVLIRTKINKKR